MPPRNPRGISRTQHGAIKLLHNTSCTPIRKLDRLKTLCGLATYAAQVAMAELSIQNIIIKDLREQGKDAGSKKTKGRGHLTCTRVIAHDTIQEL
jgi:hypothetical protein